MSTQTSTRRKVDVDTGYFLNALDVEREYGVDLITAETLRNGLIETTRHMYYSLLRSSFSAIIRDGQDFGVAVHLIHDDGSTEMCGITEGCTQFAFTHQHLVNMVLDEYGIENLGPGDTLITNDPWRAGIHFPDLNLVRVVFDDNGKPVFALSCGAHVFDIGGCVAGGFNHQATTLYEEGLRIPPMLLTSGDTIVRPVINLLVENTRSPFHIVGDVRAMLGTLRAGETRLRQLLDRYQADKVQSAAHYSLDLAERRMRQQIDMLPDGDFTAEEWMDDDGVTLEPVRVCVTVRVRGASVEIDFSGTDRQTLGSISTPWSDTARCIIGPKVFLDPRHPWNAGAMRPFDVVVPQGSVVMALPPTSQSAHTELGSIIGSLMIQALSKALPERAVAPDAGLTGSVIVHGTDHRPGREGIPFGTAYLTGEAWGGTQSSDGISYCFAPIYNVKAVVTELAEKESPVIIWEYGLVQDAAGAGKFRGGFSPGLTLEVLGNTHVSALIDRARLPAQGAAGGTSGMTTYGWIVSKDKFGSPVSWNGMLPADRMEPLYGIFDEDGRPNPEVGVFGQGARYMTCHASNLEVVPGTVLRWIMASPGGYGNPLDRDPERVSLDVRNERVSHRQAEQSYGVILNATNVDVDVDATTKLRAELRVKQDSGEWAAPISFFRDWPVTSDDLVTLIENYYTEAGL